jgi:O-antigen/teichoic acid export membrane protein
MLTTPMLSIGGTHTNADSPKYFGSVILSQITLSIISSILLVIGVLIADFLFFNGQERHLAVPIAVATLAANIQYFLRRYTFTKDAPFVGFMSDFFRYAVQIGVLVWIFRVDTLDADQVMFLIAFAGFFGIIPGVHYLWPVRTDRKTFREMARRHWEFCKWLIPSTLLTWTLYNLFMAAGGAILGATAVGGLKASQNIVAVSHILILGLENIVPVAAARHFKDGGGKGLTRYLLRFSFYGGMAMGLIVVAASIAPDYLLQIIYSDEFKGQGYLVRWWCVVYLFEFLTVPAMIGLRTMENTRPIFIQNLWLSILSVLICYPLIATFDKAGVMTGLVIITGLKFAILTLYFRKSVRSVP